MAKFCWWCLLTVAFAAPPASAEIFKCADRNGLDRYQNFPCPLDSLGSLPSNPPPAKATLPPGSTGQTRPSSMPLAVASVGRSANASEPRIGMTRHEVSAIWGEPVEIEEDEPKVGRTETWRYGDGRSVQFSNKHRVLAVQR
jgi:hypothetical protein